MQNFRRPLIFIGAAVALITAGVYAQDCYITKRSFIYDAAGFALGVAMIAWGSAMEVRGAWRVIWIVVSVLAVGSFAAFLAFIFAFKKCFEF
jgi:hypothetical protein